MTVETISITKLTQTIDKKFDRFKNFSSCGTGDYFQAAVMLNEFRMPTIEKNLCKERPSIRGVYLGGPFTYKFSKPGKRLKHKYNKNPKNNTQ